MYPRHIEFMDKLPKTAGGELLRYKLRELASGHFHLNDQENSSPR